MKHWPWPIKYVWMPVLVDSVISTIEILGIDKMCHGAWPPPHLPPMCPPWLLWPYLFCMYVCTYVVHSVCISSMCLNRQLPSIHYIQPILLINLVFCQRLYLPLPVFCFQHTEERDTQVVWQGDSERPVCSDGVLPHTPQCLWGRGGGEPIVSWVAAQPTSTHTNVHGTYCSQIGISVNP